MTSKPFGPSHGGYDNNPGMGRMGLAGWSPRATSMVLGLNVVPVYYAGSGGDPYLDVTSLLEDFDVLNVYEGIRHARKSLIKPNLLFKPMALF